MKNRIGVAVIALLSSLVSYGETLTSPVITGTAVASKTTYDYTFTAGPGEVTADLDAIVDAGAKEAFIQLELLDGGAESLARAAVDSIVERGKDKLERKLRGKLDELLSEVVGSAPAPSTKKRGVRVSLETTQNLVLRITVGPGVSQYSVRMGGALQLPPAVIASEPPAEQPAPESVTPPAAEPAPGEATAEVPPTPATPKIKLPGPKPKSTPVKIRIPRKPTQ